VIGIDEGQFFEDVRIFKIYFNVK